MNWNRQPIGGYFELETYMGTEYFEGKNIVALNLARNCLRYLLRTYHIKELYVPSYTCPVVWDAVEAEGCRTIYYEVDAHFFPSKKLPQDSFILYTNYFGICSKNIEVLSRMYKNLIIDNSQSFYSEKVGLASFNSARKYFGVPDGAYLFINRKLETPLKRDESVERFSHLILRVERGAQEGYPIFQKNDVALCNADIREMSLLTHKLLSGISYETIAERRIENFLVLNEHLQKYNELELESFDDVPMTYPFLYRKKGLREALIREEIFVPTYWKGQKDVEWGALFQKYLLPLPIDQRYSSEDMFHIIDVIKSNM